MYIYIYTSLTLITEADMEKSRDPPEEAAGAVTIGVIVAILFTLVFLIIFLLDLPAYHADIVFAVENLRQFRAQMLNDGESNRAQRNSRRNRRVDIGIEETVM